MATVDEFLKKNPPKILDEESPSVELEPIEQKFRDLAFSRLQWSKLSTGKLKTYLLKKGANVHSVNALIEELKRRKYLDDEVYGRALISQWKRTKYLGKSGFRQKLYEAGIEANVITELLQDFDYDEQERLLLFYQKNCRRDLETLEMFSENKTEDYKSYQKVFARLLRKAAYRGFSQTVAIKVLESLGFSTNCY